MLGSGGILAKGIHDDRYVRVIAMLKAERERLALNQTALGQRLGQRQQFVSKYESGERRLDLIEFVDVAEALGLDWKSVISRSLMVMPDQDEADVSGNSTTSR